MKEEQEFFKVKANMRFLNAPDGRIYDKGDVFDAGSKSYFDYITGEHKLCSPASKDAEITETEQMKQEKHAAEELERIEREQAEAQLALNQKLADPEPEEKQPEPAKSKPGPKSKK